MSRLPLDVQGRLVSRPAGLEGGAAAAGGGGVADGVLIGEFVTDRLQGACQRHGQLCRVLTRSGLVNRVLAFEQLVFGDIAGCEGTARQVVERGIHAAVGLLDQPLQHIVTRGVLSIPIGADREDAGVGAQRNINSLLQAVFAEIVLPIAEDY